MPAESLEPPLGAVPRQARSLRTRQALVDAAVTEFTRRGVANTRIQDIVSAAGVSWGTFFHYFPRKEDVLLTYASMQVGTVVLRVRELMSRGEGSTRDLALQCFNAFLSNGASPEVRSATLNEVFTHLDRFRAIQEQEGGETLAELLQELLAVGRGRGDVRPDLPVAVLAQILLVVMLGTAARVQSTRLPLQALLEIVFQVMWEGIGVSGSRAGAE